LKILTAAEMREVDERTIARGIPGIVLMETAGSSVADFLKRKFSPLRAQSIVVFCGKGNNGGDGFVVARHLFQQKFFEQLTVIEAFPREQLTGDAVLVRTMLEASGCPVLGDVPEIAYHATIVVDALLGTGVRGPASGRILELIRIINDKFPNAAKVSVDFPSGFPTDDTVPSGEYVRANYTVTFTAFKRSQVLSPSYEAMGEIEVCPIGTPDELCEADPKYNLRLSTRRDFAQIFTPRPRNSNKGMYGHVLVVGGSVGKSGAPAMTGLAALRSGAGLVTVASAREAIASIAAASPDLMTEFLPQTESGRIGTAAVTRVEELLQHKTVLALGPGLGTDDETVQLVRRLYAAVEIPAVIDADALNAMAGQNLQTHRVRILTPHPGEMGRLFKKSVKEIQAARLDAAQSLAKRSGATIVLKGDRTLIAFPDGEAWVNPTGSPAMATGGTGDILTGMIAGLVAQHTENWKRAVIAAVWLHGRAGEIGGQDIGEQALIATDLLRYLPEAIRECRDAIRE
jgi:hydroxyethylthiazole kinase-like uncharacterized protein yjeF